MTYRDVASGRVLAWAVVAIGARMPVAMAPLALVFLARDRPGGYTLGATLAAVYSVMYAAVGVGYAATGSLAGALLHFAAPSTAILAGIALTLPLSAAGAWGEGVRRPASLPAAGGDGAVLAVGAGGTAADGVRGAGAERPPVGGGCDPERRL